MKKNLFFLLAAFICFSVSAQVQVTINPIVGINYSTFNYPDNDTTLLSKELGGRVGFQVGPTLRIGRDWWYVQPGFLWIRQGVSFESADVDSTTLTNIKDNIYLTGFQIPLNFGANIVNKDAFRIRAMVGMDLTLITGVTDNKLNFNKDYYKSPALGGRLGLGLDVLFLTFDVGVFRGFSDVYDVDYFQTELGRKMPSIKPLGVYANVGFQYTFKGNGDSR